MLPNDPRVGIPGSEIGWQSHSKCRLGQVPPPTSGSQPSGGIARLILGLAQGRRRVQACMRVVPAPSLLISDGSRPRLPSVGLPPSQSNS